MPQTLRSSQPLHDDDGDPNPTASAEAALHDAAKQDEANMRRALGMLGGAGGKPRSPQASPKPNPDRRPSPAPLSSNPRRHRFVQDGDVPVTVMRRPEGAPEAPAGASPSNRLDAVQALLTAERAQRERADRALDEAQGVIRDLRTKLAHMELAREEALRPKPVEAATEVGAADASPAEIERPARRTRGPGKKTMAERAAKPAREPKPIKWWVKPRARKVETPGTPGTPPV